MANSSSSKAPSSSKTPPAPRVDGPLDDFASLPPRVAALREKILDACATRDVEALKVPIQWAETPPIFLRGPGRPKISPRSSTFCARAPSTSAASR
ncbi:MAG: hypothetical protein HZY79_15285 [Rhodoblastus sp.]|nr:MAG: hypothetical protein HZY79_15285 [Rhodoblastus sp.]